jgi:hypothetical protein
MDTSDRRYSPRYAMKIPIRFREMEAISEPERCTGETTNISRTEVFPRELSGSAKSEVHCMGRVVRMEYR